MTPAPSDPLEEFKEGEFPQVYYDIINAGDGIMVKSKNVSDNVKEVEVGLASIGPAATFVSPSKLAINQYGQVTSVIQGSADILPVDFYGDVNILSSQSVAAVRLPKNTWSGRWFVKHAFSGPVKVSFRVSAPGAFVGLTRSGNFKDDQFLPVFEAGFHFDAGNVSVVDNSLIKSVRDGLTRLGPWNPTDLFSIIFTGTKIIHYQNGVRIYTRTKGHVAHPLFAAGAFFTTQTTSATVSHLSVSDYIHVIDDIPCSQTIMRTANNCNISLTSEIKLLTQVTLKTTVPGNISVWGSADAPAPLTLQITIVPEVSGCSDDSSSTMSDDDGALQWRAKCCSIFGGTSEYLPAATYRILLSASSTSSVTVERANIMAMGNLT